MTTTDIARAEAVAWLVGRLRFERLLDDLQRRADQDAAIAGVPASALRPAKAA